MCKGVHSQRPHLFTQIKSYQEKQKTKSFPIAIIRPQRPTQDPHSRSELGITGDSAAEASAISVDEKALRREVTGVSGYLPLDITIKNPSRSFLSLLLRLLLLSLLVLACHSALHNILRRYIPRRA